jgi:hypothetical protein
LSAELSHLAYTTDDLWDCTIVCKRLRAAGVPFNVMQESHQVLRAVERRFRIYVSRSDEKQASEVIYKDQLDFTDEPQDQEIMELPYSDVIESREPNRRKKVRAGSSEEIATEVWDGDDPERLLIIELSLRENQISFATEEHERGTRILVSSEDKSRSLEIIREIIEGKPPQ